MYHVPTKNPSKTKISKFHREKDFDAKKDKAPQNEFHKIQGSNFTTATTANAVPFSAFAVMPYKFYIYDGITMPCPFYLLP